MVRKLLRRSRILRNVLRMSKAARTPPHRAGSHDKPDTADLKYLLVREVADILRLSPRRVHGLAHEGELDFAMFGRAMRITERSLRDYITRAHEAARAS